MLKNSKRSLKKLIQNLNETILCQSNQIEGLSRLGLVLVNLSLKSEKNERALNFYFECKETLEGIYSKYHEINQKYKKE